MMLFIMIDFELYTFEKITSSHFKFLAMILLFFTANHFKK